MALRIPRRRKNKTGGPEQQGRNPHILSGKGILMLGLAVIFDIVNIILGILDFFLIGIILSPMWNFIAVGTLGTLLWIWTGQSRAKTKRKQRLVRVLVKRIALPFIGNNIPLFKFFPFWIWSVWSSLDKSVSSPTMEEQEQPTAQAQSTPATAS